ncbi:MAG TPA: BTAD domain-containing putative transcriptional regulator, partial [Micromonosporaceae bacterium]|nr:BTAD domain-containing putative transcriptional regulator [Micromonosporaceae bacterium]
MSATQPPATQPTAPPAALAAPEFRLLGSMHIQVGTGTITAPAAKPAAILALLLLRANEFVPTEEIAEKVWGGDGGVSDGTIHGYVAQLRSLLKSVDTTITTGTEGYRVDVDPLRVDVHLFRQLVAEARARPVDARACLDAALALWRGIPFPGTHCAWLREYRIDLLEERRDASHRRNAEWIAAGLHEELLEDLRVLVRKYPYDDRLAADHMMCLYRSGYVGEALAFYRGFHKRIGHAEGRQPAEMLRQLNMRMVRQDESLDPGASGSVAAAPPQMLGPEVTALVGRAGQLDDVQARLRSAARSVAVVQVVGPPGIGKTAFALALAN